MAGHDLQGHQACAHLPVDLQVPQGALQVERAGDGGVLQHKACAANRLQERRTLRGRDRLQGRHIEVDVRCIAAADGFRRQAHLTGAADVGQFVGGEIAHGTVGAGQRHRLRAAACADDARQAQAGLTRQRDAAGRSHCLAIGHVQATHIGLHVDAATHHVVGQRQVGQRRVQ